jgi:RNA polymerase sigma-70 factor (ECF subfamily)
MHPANCVSAVVSEERQWSLEDVEQAQAGDTSAFDRLYRRFYSPICLFLAHMVGDYEEGCDLAQETFLKAWQGIRSIQNGSRFDTWLYRIATNTAIDYLRRRKFRWPLYKQSEDEGLPDSLCVSGPEERTGELEHIEKALAQVALKYRSCLLLQLVADLPQREIARSLNISEKSVSVYVSRGSEQFRLAYQRISQGSGASSKVEERTHETSHKPDAYALYRLGANAYGQAPG